MNSLENGTIIQTIITQLNSQDDGGRFAAIQSLITLFMGSIQINVQIPELHFDPDWHITNNELWQNIEKGIRNQEVMLDMAVPTQLKTILETIFTKTKEIQNIPQYWLIISAFLSDIALRNVDLLIYFAASASFVIISQLINVRNAAVNNDIKQSLSLCIGCIDRMMVLVAEEKKSVYRQLSFNLELEFLAIIQTKSILLTPNTFNIFKKNLLYKGHLTVKTLDITRKFLKSRNQADKLSIFEFYNEEESKLSLARVIGESTVPEIEKAIQITIDLVKYSKENEVAFECDWVAILKHIFSSKRSIKDLSIKLLIMKFRDVTEYSVLEIALHVFRYTNEDIAEGMSFIDTFEPYEDFKDTTKLFHLLRNSINDLGKFQDIASVLIASVKKYNENDAEYVGRLSPMVTQLFEVINLVRNKPKMLCSLIDVVKLQEFIDEREFEDNFKALKITLTNCILNTSHSYDTIVRLCRGLKQCRPSAKDIEIIFRKIYKDCHFANNTNVQDRAKILTTCAYFLAADDVFNLFKNVKPSDKRELYNELKEWFQRNNNHEIKAFICSLIINMLATFYAINRIPSMPKAYIKGEAEMYRQYINEGILKVNVNPPIKNILLCTAFCHLYTSMQALLIESPVLNKVYSILSTYMKDENLRKEYFVSIYWLGHKLHELLNRRIDITETPHSLVLLWDGMTNVCVYNDFLKVIICLIWNYGADQMFFVDTMQKALYEIHSINNAKKLVDNVLKLIKYHYRFNNLESVASLIVIKMIQRKHDNPRVKMTFLEMMIEHLDKKYITSREMVLTFLNDPSHSTDIEVRNIMQKFRKYFTAEPRRTSTNIKATRKRVATVTNTATTTDTATTTNTATTSRPAGGESSSRAKRPKRSSVPAINVTINTDASNSNNDSMNNQTINNQSTFVVDR